VTPVYLPRKRAVPKSVHNFAVQEKLKETTALPLQSGTELAAIRFYSE